MPRGIQQKRGRNAVGGNLLDYLNWPAQRSFLHLAVTAGNSKLADVAGRFVDEVHRRVEDVQIRLSLDAGAAMCNEDLVRLDRCTQEVWLIQAPRRKGYRERWEALPRELFTPFEEPGRYVGAKAKACEIAETTTPIKGIERPVRTIVVRERAMRGKDRWHALFILHDDVTPTLDLLHEYRSRQCHEQVHRIGVRDLWIDTCPSGYPNEGRPDRPGFRQGPLQLCAWIAALVWDALRGLGCFPRPCERRRLGGQPQVREDRDPCGAQPPARTTHALEKKPCLPCRAPDQMRSQTHCRTE